MNVLTKTVMANYEIFPNFLTSFLCLQLTRHSYVLYLQDYGVVLSTKR